jgi:hypothetical protein
MLEDLAGEPQVVRWRIVRQSSIRQKASLGVAQGVGARIGTPPPPRPAASVEGHEQWKDIIPRRTWVGGLTTENVELGSTHKLFRGRRPPARTAGQLKTGSETSAIYVFKGAIGRANAKAATRMVGTILTSEL